MSLFAGLMNIALLQDKATTASALMKVLANESRLLILCQLVDGDKSVNELEGLVGLRQSALSQHLAILRRERLVRTKREAQFIFYSLASPEVRAIMKTLYQIYCTPRR
jgi:DNA-binding transcriptional ArsR family regulator